MNKEMFGTFVYWIRERESVRKKKEAGEPQPWSDNDIFNLYHFCNVRREDDRGTKEIRAVGKRVPIHDLPKFYTIARLLNSAKSAAVYLERPDWWEALKEEREKGNTVFHTAYVVSTCGKPMDKLDYIADLAQSVGEIEVPRTSCAAAFSALVKLDGLGSFLAAQVVADLKNDRYLENAPDFDTFSVIGPGSRKGMDFIFDGGTTPGNYERRISELEMALPKDIQEMELHRQDLQNCLCEFSKYVRYAYNLPGRRRTYAKIQRRK